jgi:hypothetical protein
MSSIDRLRKWAETWPGQRTVSVQRRDQDWLVSVAVPSPAKISHSAARPSLDEAASECITVLEQIGEEVPAG